VKRHLIYAASLCCLALALSTLASAADVGAAPTLTLDGAHRAVAAATAYARAHDAPGGAIAVVDAGGQTIVVGRP